MLTFTTRHYNKQAVLKLALAIVPVIRRDLIEREENYREECKRWAKEGYRPEYCIHGIYLWADYDPICGYCESGEDENPSAIALGKARDAIKKCQERKDSTWDAALSVATNDMALTMKMFDYMVEPMTALLKRYKVSGSPVQNVFIATA